MNNHPVSVIIFWLTRSKKRHKKIIQICKNYGLVPIVKTVMIGSLAPTQEKAFLSLCKNMLNLKTDRFLFTRMCQTCLQNSCLGTSVSDKLRVLPFELVQMGEGSSILVKKQKT
jgi:hypothetical protein